MSDVLVGILQAELFLGVCVGLLFVIWSWATKPDKDRGFVSARRIKAPEAFNLPMNLPGTVQNPSDPSPKTRRKRKR